MYAIKRTSLIVFVWLLAAFLFIGLSTTQFSDIHSARAATDIPIDPPPTNQAGEAPEDQSSQESAAFSQAEMVGSATEIREGNFIDYTIIIRNTGTESLPDSGIHNPIPTSAMLISYSPEMVYDEKERALSWHGEVAPGKEMRFHTRLVPMPDSAGCFISNWAMASSTEGKSYLTFMTEIRSKDQPVVVQTPGGIGIGNAGIIVISYLIFLPLFILIAPRLIFVRQRRMEAASPGMLKTDPNKIMVYAMTILFALLISVLMGLGAVVHMDMRIFNDYRQTEATITDKAIKSFTSKSSDKKGARSEYHEPLVAVQYVADGSEISAAGSIARGSFLSTNEAKAQSLLARYDIGRAYPCWYDPLAPENFVLRRSFSWSWYMLGAGPLLLFWISGRYLFRKLLGKDILSKRA